ncbi:hypothetical protein ACTXJ3_07495 [Brachybacterium paraconglomeratum]|uniref:hypothetical protein n=1 Tax=Brachybacterium paraconglomeratum TaxID=173362 RepID=UPI003FD0613E
MAHILPCNAARRHRSCVTCSRISPYRAFEAQDGFAAVATLDQIAHKSHSLAIPLYVAGESAKEAGEHLNVSDAVTQWRAAAQASDQASADVLALLGAEVTA